MGAGGHTGSPTVNRTNPFFGHGGSVRHNRSSITQGYYSTEQLMSRYSTQIDKRLIPIITQTTFVVGCYYDHSISSSDIPSSALYFHQRRCSPACPRRPGPNQITFSDDFACSLASRRCPTLAYTSSESSFSPLSSTRLYCTCHWKLISDAPFLFHIHQSQENAQGSRR
jgi:hypothetical protein